MWDGLCLENDSAIRGHLQDGRATADGDALLRFAIEAAPSGPTALPPKVTPALLSMPEPPSHIIEGFKGALKPERLGQIGCSDDFEWVMINSEFPASR